MNLLSHSDARSAILICLKQESIPVVPGHNAAISFFRAAAFGALPIFVITRCEELLLLQLDPFPRRVAEDDIEPGIVATEHVLELEMPVKKAVRPRQRPRPAHRPELVGSLDLAPLLRIDVVDQPGIVGQPFPGRLRRWFRCARLQWPEKGGRPAIGDQLLAPEVGTLAMTPVEGFLPGHTLDRIILAFESVEITPQRVVVLDRRDRPLERQLPFPLLRIPFADRRSVGFLVAGDLLERVGRNPVDHHFRGRADQRVPLANMVIEKADRFARFVRFQPERHLAEINCERVEIDAVDAMLDRFADTMPDPGCGRFFAAAFDRRQFPPDSPRRCQQEMSRTASGIADLEIEESRPLVVRCPGLREPVLDHRHQRTLDQFLDQTGIGVVGPGFLARGAGIEPEFVALQQESRVPDDARATLHRPRRVLRHRDRDS